VGGGGVPSAGGGGGGGGGFSFALFLPAGDAATPMATVLHGDEKVANREIRAWHGASEKAP
jgi:hypothetical protein